MMQIQVHCPNCGKGYLVNEGRVPTSGGFVPCQICGTIIPLTARPQGRRPPAAQAGAGSGRAPAPPSAVNTPAARAAAPPAGEVCCPRCQFRFVPGATETNPGRVRRTLLVVEDTDYFLEMAREALSSRYEVTTAKTLAEARARLAAGGIDLLLLDITLEHGEDGLRLLREPPGKRCPVLLLTAQDEADMYGDGWDRLRSAGVDDVIIKGMNMDEALQRKVAEMLGEPSPDSAPVP